MVRERERGSQYQDYLQLAELGHMANSVAGKSGKCSLYLGQPCAQISVPEIGGDSVER